MCETCSAQAGDIAEKILDVLNGYREKGLTYATVLGTFRILEDILLKELDDEFELEQGRSPSGGLYQGELFKPQNPRMFQVLRKHAETGSSEDEGDRSGAAPEAP